MADPLIQGALWSMTPLGELRAGIPVAVAQGANPLAALAVCVLANALVAPLLFLFLNTAHHWFLRIPLYHRFSMRYLDRARDKAETKLQRWGMLGLLILVAIPLPLTGAYTGAAAAWVLGMRFSRAFPPIAAGVLIAGVIVLSVTAGVIKGIALVG